MSTLVIERFREFYTAPLATFEANYLPLDGGPFFSSSSSPRANRGFKRSSSAVYCFFELQSPLLSALVLGLGREIVRASGGIVSGYPLTTSFMPPGDYSA